MLSFVIVIYRMSQQARNTLYSLSAAHQRGVDADDYEVIVVENPSDDMLGPEVVSDLQGSFRYISMATNDPAPVAAVRAGVEASSGEHLALMVDGARLVTPGVVRGLLDAISAQRDATPVVVVPSYHLGDELQQDAVHRGYDSEAETRLLSDLGWPADGYSVFRRSVLAASAGDGFLMPMAESNCLALPRDLYDRLGGLDPRFRTPGGGFANLDLYQRVVTEPGVRLVVLPGEGTFHQFHGGATTGEPGVDRDARLAEMADEYRTIRGADFYPAQVRPVMFGEVGIEAAPFLAHSRSVLRRARRQAMHPRAVLRRLAR